MEVFALRKEIRATEKEMNAYDSKTDKFRKAKILLRKLCHDLDDLKTK